MSATTKTVDEIIKQPPQDRFLYASLCVNIVLAGALVSLWALYNRAQSEQLNQEREKTKMEVAFSQERAQMKRECDSATRANLLQWDSDKKEAINDFIEQMQDGYRAQIAGARAAKKASDRAYKKTLGLDQKVQSLTQKIE